MPALLELGPAVIALLVLLAVWLLVLIAENVIPNLPLIGSALRDFVVNGLTFAINAIEGFLKSIVRPILDVLWRVQVWNMRLLGWGLNALERVPWTINTSTGVSVQRAQGMVNSANANAANLFNSAEGYTAQVGNAANAYSYSLYANGIAYINGQIGLALAAAATAESAAMEHADAIHAVDAAAIGNVAANATIQAQGAVTHADNLFTSAQASIGQLAGTIPIDIANAVRTAEGYADGAAQAAAAAASAGVLAKVLPQIATLTTEAETCLRPLCDTVTPNAPQLGRLGSILQDMETLITDGSMLALVVYLLTQQRQAAQDITAVVSDVVAPIMQDAKSLL